MTHKNNALESEPHDQNDRLIRQGDEVEIDGAWRPIIALHFMEAVSGLVFGWVFSVGDRRFRRTSTHLTRPAPAADWAIRPGTFQVRHSCPEHPGVQLLTGGTYAVLAVLGALIAACPVCNKRFTLCGATFSRKSCVLVVDHDGNHVSPSGSSWPREPDPCCDDQVTPDPVHHVHQRTPHTRYTGTGITADELRAEREKSGCPCLFTEPCSKVCSCVSPWMSGGCRRCCLYGSLEQQRWMAKHLAALSDQSEELAVAGKLLAGEEQRHAKEEAEYLATLREQHDQVCELRARIALHEDLTSSVERARAEEREACAAWLMGFQEYQSMGPHAVAAAIRAGTHNLGKKWRST